MSDVVVVMNNGRASRRGRPRRVPQAVDRVRGPVHGGHEPAPAKVTAPTWSRSAGGTRCASRRRRTARWSAPTSSCRCGPGDATVLTVDDTRPPRPTIPGEVVFVRDLGTTFECFVDCGLDEPLWRRVRGATTPTWRRATPSRSTCRPTAAWWWRRDSPRPPRHPPAPTSGSASAGAARRPVGARRRAGRVLPRAVLPDAGDELLPAHRGWVLRAGVRVRQLVRPFSDVYIGARCPRAPVPARGAAHDRGGVPVHVVPHPHAAGRRCRCWWWCGRRPCRR